MGSYSSIPATLGKKKIKERQTSCTPFLKLSRLGFGGIVWRDVRLSPSLLSMQQRGNTVLVANTRGKCSTKIQPIAGKEHQACFSLGLKVCDHTLV